MRVVFVVLIIFAAAACAANDESKEVNVAPYALVSVKVGPLPNPFFNPILNLFSYTNCSNDGLNTIGDRLSYMGSQFAYCDGPVYYTYDKGPPGKNSQVYMTTHVTYVSPGIYMADFQMWNDSKCTVAYNFMGNKNDLFQAENSCRIYRNDAYNPTAVVSASVTISAAPKTHNPTLLATTVAIILAAKLLRISD